MKGCEVRLMIKTSQREDGGGERVELEMWTNSRLVERELRSSDGIHERENDLEEGVDHLREVEEKKGTVRVGLGGRVEKREGRGRTQGTLIAIAGTKGKRRGEIVLRVYAEK